MSNCELCGNEHNRFIPNSTKRPARYCSTKCIKKAYYYRNNPEAKSLGKNDAFWETETGKGFKWEKYVADKMNGTHFEFNKDGVDVSFELAGKTVNVDVKAAEQYRHWWVFNKNKPKPHIDYFYCVCLKNGNVFKELLIPRESFKSCGISVGNKSSYDKYKL